MPNLERLVGNKIPKDKRVTRLIGPKNIVIILSAEQRPKDAQVEKEVNEHAPLGVNFYKIGPSTDTFYCAQEGDMIKHSYPVVYIKLE